MIVHACAAICAGLFKGPELSGKGWWATNPISIPMHFLFGSSFITKNLLFDTDLVKLFVRHLWTELVLDN